MSIPGVGDVLRGVLATTGDERPVRSLRSIVGEMPLAINWFRGGKKAQEPQDYSVDDLIVLERYEEAEEKLRARLKANPSDLHSHLKLADVYTSQRQFAKAVDEYVYAAEEYAQDGFHDKGLALLARAAKLAPLDTTLGAKMARLQRDKDMEHTRELALEGLRAAGGTEGTSSALEIQRLWRHLAQGALVQKLPGESLKRLFAAMELRRYEAGEALAAEGSAEPFLLLILQGEVEASISEGGRATSVRSFGSGDLIGDGVLLERGAWPADYRVAEAVTALRLAREGLERCLLGNSDPRGFLSVLREQRHDRLVAESAARLRAGS